MPRPRLEIGTHGKVRYLRTSSGWIARTLFRDYDGQTRPVEKSGRTKGEAERRLKLKLKDWSGSMNGGLSSESYVRDLAELWLQDVIADVANDKKSPGTETTYRSILDRHVLPGVGGLRIREANVSRLDRFLGALSNNVGVATAKTARSALSGMLGYAARQGIIGVNPVRDTRPLSVGRRKGPRALTLEERTQWLEQLERDKKASRWDLPDLSRFLMATGVRIGEALALYWEDVDLKAGSVDINYTVTRVRGEGLIRKSTKSAAGERVLPLPTWAVEMLRGRKSLAGGAASTPVFPSSSDTLRDPNNVARVLRETRGSEGFGWVTSHVFRKTAATVLDEAGLSARLVADQLGHARPSMTQDVYLARKVASPDTAAALEDVLGKEAK